jgi:hypothetical protein
MADETRRLLSANVDDALSATIGDLGSWRLTHSFTQLNRSSYLSGLVFRHSALGPRPRHSTVPEARRDLRT